MTEVLSDSSFLSPEGIYKRTSSEPDIFGAGVRQRTCSNTSQLRYNRARERSRTAFTNKERSRSPSPNGVSNSSDIETQMVVDGRYDNFLEVHYIIYCIYQFCNRLNQFALHSFHIQSYVRYSQIFLKLLQHLCNCVVMLACSTLSGSSCEYCRKLSVTLRFSSYLVVFLSLQLFLEFFF